ncbi:MAG: cytochrome P450 [Acidimicrobiaceae bacterium]|nr:cytochrome P450 [Acidimicrobiaceae bacterium]
MAADDRVVVDFDQHSPTYKAGFPSISHGLRSQCPVVWSEQHGGYWVVTGRELIGQMAKRPDLLSNDHDPLGRRRGYGGVAIPTPVNSQSRGGFLEMDPPEQLAYRQVLNAHLSPSAIERWRPMVADLARACIDEVIETGRIDFVDDFANIVPAVLTMGMLGFPLVDWVHYCEPAHATVYTPPGSPEWDRVVELLLLMAARLANELDRAKTNPRPGMLASLVEAQQRDPDVFNDEDLLGTLTLLIGGGFDTTTALLSHAVHWLDGRPAERARLVKESSLLDTATEEFLRFVTPAQGGGRTITADCEIAGHRFREGDRVWMAYALTNHDAEAFPDPDEMVIDRFPNRHAAFGLGVHRCIGSNLARMSFKTMLGEVLTRIPDYEIHHEGIVRYEDVGTINGYQHMPAVFSPGRRAGEPLKQVIDRWQVALDGKGV